MMISQESLGQSYWIQENGRHERNNTKPWISQYIEAMTMRTMSHRFNPSPFCSYHALRRRNRIQLRLRGTFKTCTLEDRQLIRSAFTPSWHLLRSWYLTLQFTRRIHTE